MSVETITRKHITVEPMGKALGARVRGVDMREPLSDEKRQELLDAWGEYLVLCFPDQHVSDAEHVAFTRNFGEPEIFHQKIIRSERQKEIFRVANVDETTNEVMGANDPTRKQISLAELWHTDSSYRPEPCVGALLHGIEVTKTGGETQFCNMYKVYEALPPHLKKQVEGRKARHDFEQLHRLQPLKPLTPEERASMPPVWHPMVRIHPVTRRKSLYISPIYNDAVEGMSPEDSKKLIDELFEFCSRPEFVYSHKWTNDDVLMWDNRCTMHQVTGYDLQERRVMHRTTIAGTEPVVAA